MRRILQILQSNQREISQKIAEVHASGGHLSVGKLRRTFGWEEALSLTDCVTSI